jgi:CheY-like chemotaxis protein
MLPSPPLFVAAGPWDRREFASLRAELDPNGEWPTAASLSALLEQLATDERSASAPELVLLAQPTPGENQQPAIEALRTLAPLARIICIAGSWCEGELRTGRPPDGVIRLYWYEFAPWWRAVNEATGDGRTPAWSEPLDDPRSGQQTPFSEIAIAREHQRDAGPRSLAVDAADFAVFETLAAVLAPFGWQCHWRPRGRRNENTPVATLDAAVWDGAQLSDIELNALREFMESIHATNPAAPIIALLDFPRVEHLTAARCAGAAAILAKPYQLAQLVNELERLTAATSVLTTDPVPSE